MNVTRRRLLQAGATLVASGLIARPRAATVARTNRTAAIIGHTGAGDYGHGIERLFAGLPEVRVVAVADPHSGGRAKAKAASGALRDYADYREMLDREKPELVAIGPRWANEHHAMARAALTAGAHLYLEKPFTVSLAEADDLLHLAQRQHRRIAVAHVTRCAPRVLRLERALSEGLIGALLEIHTVGKMGARAGGQDMMVLGIHVFDLARVFAGEVQWCHARIRVNGRPPLPDDARETPADRVGPVVGDDIFAHFAMASGVNVTFRSRAGLEQAAGPFGMEIVGSRGKVRLHSGAEPEIFLLARPKRDEPARPETWMAWTGGISPSEETTIDGLTGYDAAHRRVVRDWLQSIDERREPLCSGERARQAIEMAHGVFQSGLEGRKVDFPLVQRAHPLAQG
jgi:predicted dehydrogenase